MRQTNTSYPWVLACSLVTGIISGVLALLYYLLAIVLIWDNVLPGLFEPFATMFVPGAGLFIAGMIVTYLARGDAIYGTDALLSVYHRKKREIDPSVAPGKIASSVPAIGLGGSAGISAPLIYMGGFIGQLVYRIFRLDESDADSFQIVLISGAAAGFSAALRAPLAGVLFALEVPYRRTLTPKPAISALISAVVAYAIVAAPLGKTLFAVPTTGGFFTLGDILGAAGIGIACGVGGYGYVVLHRAAKSAFRSGRVPRYVKGLLGGLITGFIGFFGLLATGAPFVLGPGYESERAAAGFSYSPLVFVLMVVLKAFATAVTLGSGAFGGAIESFIVMGSSVGAAWGGLVPVGSSHLMPVFGIAGFLAAAYNVPLAAGVLAAEISRSPAALVPALVTALVARVISGPSSVLEEQVGEEATAEAPRS